MNQGLTTEEILHRLRMHVSQYDAVRPPSGTASQSPINGTPLLHPGLHDGGSAFGFRPESHDLSRLRIEIDTALDGTRQVGQLNPRNPGLVNAAIQFLKKIMRRSLAWYTRPIHYFQGAVIRALQETLVLLQGHVGSIQTSSRELVSQAGTIEALRQELAVQRGTLTDGLATLDDKVSALRESTTSLADDYADIQTQLGQTRVDLDESLRRMHSEVEQNLGRVQSSTEERLSQMNSALVDHMNRGLTVSDQRVVEIQREIARLQHEIGRVTNELRETKIHGRVRERDWRRFFHDIQTQQKASDSALDPLRTPPMFPSGIKSEKEFDYYLFEELHRGEESLIASRQREYLDFFKGRNNVVDIGCGRGEFLEVLRENGISARGVELGTDQYLLCQEKGLDVLQQDLFTFLESVPDAALGGLFSAQVIEHLTASDQLRFVALAYAKTSPGSPVIIETINAQSVFAIVRNFFMDPTHIRPVHPETLKFAMQSINFRDVELRYSSPLLEKRIPPLIIGDDPSQLADFNRATDELNDLIYGCLDYAVIGWH
ncbi:MAG TPA: methionine biosynthesis protein MetW [Terriglobales bacterium]